MGTALTKPLQDVLCQRDSEQGDKRTSNFCQLEHLQAFLRLIKCRAKTKSEFQSARSLHRERGAVGLFDWRLQILVDFPMRVTTRKLLG